MNPSLTSDKEALVLLGFEKLTNPSKELNIHIQIHENEKEAGSEQGARGSQAAWTEAGKAARR